MAALLHSRKFLLLLMDIVLSAILYFVGKYAGASAFEDIQFLIVVLQPAFLSVIGGIAYEDAATSKALGQAGATVNQIVRSGKPLSKGSQD